MFFYDFVGFVVVYVLGGWLVLVVVLLLGSCNGCYCDGKLVVMVLLSILFLVLGLWILIIGWFGFNVMSV